MKFLLLSSTMISSLLFMAFHPVMIMILTILQTLNICMIIWGLHPSAWFAFILFLIFIGGLMVLFIYITSLAANEKFNLKMTTNQIKTNQVLILATLLVVLALLNFKTNLTPTPTQAQISPIFMSLISPATILIMSYLLVTLIIAVKISSKMEGPLRSIMKK